MFDGPVRERHESRYRIAASFITNGDSILDAGCGTGYGALLLRGGKYYGVDVDTSHVSGLEAVWGRIVQADLCEYIPDFPYDIFVGFEVIEHLDDYSNFIHLAHNAKRLLAVSAPIVPTVGKNPYHKHDFTMDSLKAAFEHPDWRLTWEMVQHDARSGMIVMERA